MKTVLSLFFLIHLVTTAVPLPAQKRPPQPLYSVDLSKLVSQELDINPAGTLRFLTERTVAVSICRNLRCYLETLDLGAVKPQVIGGIRTDAFQVIGTLFRAPDGDVIAGNRVLDLKLREVSQIPKDAATRPSYISTTGETFVKQDRNDWVAYKMELPRQRILSGTGTILSVSDDALAYFDEGTVHIEGTDGTTLGSFATLPPKTLTFGSSSITPKSIPMLRFLGRDRLWSEDGSDVRILDFSGKTVQTFERPDGWGFRIGQSSDGSRILYDRDTRHIPLARKIEKNAAAAMGAGADEEPNGETVLVIDTRSGKQCFEWNSSANLLVAGQFHADIDPSGRLIAIMTPTTLNIYRLPQSCVAD
ncbi:MAG: hypothetical protein WBQ03_06180 [Candidatus Sulfotelmatobacter sp.]